MHGYSRPVLGVSAPKLGTCGRTHGFC
jgi:hypothetical protein